MINMRFFCRKILAARKSIWVYSVKIGDDYRWGTSLWSLRVVGVNNNPVTMEAVSPHFACRQFANCEFSQVNGRN